MIWLEVKTEGAAEPPYRYTCSHCGSLWMTVDADRQPPNECKACGAKEETPSVTADAAPPPSEREAYGRSRTPAPTAVPEGGEEDG